MDMENPSFREVFERMWQHVLTKLNGFVPNETFNNHVEDASNPHGVTAEQVGLAKVDNTSDMDKPISNLVQAALDAKADEYHTHSNYATTGHSHSEYANYSHTHNNATTSKAGFMSASDKTKLDGLSGSSSALQAYPVGAIYISVVSTSPASLFGGTWEQIKGRFLLAAGSNTKNTSTTYGSLSSGSINRSAGEQGGEVWHTLTNDEMPSHVHDFGSFYSFYDMYEPYSNYAEITIEELAYGSDVYDTGWAGDDEPHNNMPPYLVVYMWKRTA